MVGASKLNKEKLTEIRALFTQGLSDNEIAEQYGVSRIHINHIRNGHRWNKEKRSFVMKDEMQQTKLTNYFILRVMDGDKVIKASSFDISDLVNYKDYITESFVNRSGGISIIAEIDIDELILSFDKNLEL